MPEDIKETNASPHPNSGFPTMNGASQARWTLQTVLSTLPKHSAPITGSTSPLSFFHLISRLKTNKREGWRRFGLQDGESIADHMYRMSIITMLCPTSLSCRLDIPRCTRMALIHDMAESLVGDITPVDGVSKEEKNRREAETMDYLTKELLGNVDGGAQGQSMREVWQEYEDSKTEESKFVHDVDKIELMLQMVEYEKTKEGKLDLGEFTWVARKVVLPEMQEWTQSILAEREIFWKGIGKVPNGVTQDADKQKGLEEYYGEDNEQQQ